MASLTTSHFNLLAVPGAVFKPTTMYGDCVIIPLKGNEDFIHQVYNDKKQVTGIEIPLGIWDTTRGMGQQGNAPTHECRLTTSQEYRTAKINRIKEYLEKHCTDGVYDQAAINYIQSVLDYMKPVDGKFYYGERSQHRGEVKTAESIAADLFNRKLVLARFWPYQPKAVAAQGAAVGIETAPVDVAAGEVPQAEDDLPF